MFGCWEPSSGWGLFGGLTFWGFLGIRFMSFPGPYHFTDVIDILDQAWDGLQALEGSWHL